MKAIHVSAYFAPAWGFGGPPRSLLALCRAQRAAGLDVEVFTTTANPAGELPARPDGVDLEGIRVRYFPLGPPRRLLGAPSMSGPLALAASGADVVHLHGLFNRTIWLAAAAVRGRAPMVLSPRGMLEAAALAHHAVRKRAAWRLVDRRIVRDAACLHASSPAEAATLAARFPGACVVEIPNSAPAIEPAPLAVADARRRFELGAGPYVLFLGRLHPIKRLDLLAAAFLRLAAAHPDVQLVVAGPDETGERARVAPRLAPVADRVRWCGEVGETEKAGLLAGARALVCCSDSESFGMSVAEALAAGVPAVVTRTCPWAILEEAGAGAWVAQSPGAIADAVARLLDDEALASAMGARGRVLAREQYSDTAVGARWRALYAELGREAPAPASGGPR